VELSCGNYVDVYDKQLARDLTGVLRFKGLVDGVKGTHFGVELIVSIANISPRYRFLLTKFLLRNYYEK